MKRLIALSVIVILSLALTSCGFIAATPEFEAEKLDGGGTYYTALNIDLISFTDGSGTNYFELQIGVRNEVIGGYYDSDDLEKFNEDINSSIEQTLKRKGYPVTAFGFFYQGRETWTGELSPDYYVNYVYLIGGGSEVYVTDRHFGFFDYGYDYVIINPEFVNRMREDIYDTVTPLLNPYAEVDDEAVRMRYFFATDTRLASPDAVKVQKDIASISMTCDCLMWSGGETYEFTSLDANISVMASGWYIVPIILSIAVVVVILLIKPRKKENVFRTDGELSEPFVMGSDKKSGSDDVFTLRQDNTEDQMSEDVFALRQDNNENQVSDDSETEDNDAQ